MVDAIPFHMIQFGSFPTNWDGSVCDIFGIALIYVNKTKQCRYVQYLKIKMNSSILL